MSDESPPEGRSKSPFKRLKKTFSKVRKDTSDSPSSYDASSSSDMEDEKPRKQKKMKKMASPKKKRDEKKKNIGKEKKQLFKKRKKEENPDEAEVSMSSSDEKPKPKSRTNKKKTESDSSYTGTESSEGGASTGRGEVSTGKPETSKSSTPKDKRKKDGGKRTDKESDQESSATETSIQSDDTSAEGSEEGGGGDVEETAEETEEGGVPAAQQLADTKEAMAFDEGNIDQKKPFQIRCRVLEAKELQGLNLDPLCRVFVGGKMRYTRTRRATNAPTWDQTLHFSVQRSVKQLTSENIEFKVYTARRLISDALIGAFKCNLGLIYRQPQHSIINKWLALTQSSEGDSDLSITGFLKVSVSVLRPGQSGPAMTGPGKTKDDYQENVLFGSGAQFRHHSLQVRVFEITDLPPFRKLREHKVTEYEQYVVLCEAALGRQTLATKFVWNNQSQVGQELLLPMMWPSVVKYLQLRLLQVKGQVKRLNKLGKSDLKNAQVIGIVDLCLKDICCAGEDGFLPTFGPGYLSFYAPLQKVTKRSKLVPSGANGGSQFCGRVLVEVNCLAQKTDKVRQAQLSTADLLAAQDHRRRSLHSLYCNFFSASDVDPEFKSHNISFEVSIGQYSNSNYDCVQTHRTSSASRTPAVMPLWDGKNCYGMPWGNFKPCCEVLCGWEDCAQRIEVINFLSNNSAKLKEKSKEVNALLGSSIKENKLAAIIIAVIEEVRKNLEDLEVVKNMVDKTELDRRLRKLRLTRLGEMDKKMAKLKFEKLGASDELAITEGAQHVAGYAHILDSLAKDIQIHIPDIVIRMLVGKKDYKLKEIAFARVPPSKVFYSAGYRGIDCGQISPIFFKWSDTRLSKSRGFSVPALLHVRMWLSKYENRNVWHKVALDRGNMKFYAELWQNQKRKFIRVSNEREWYQTKPSFSNEQCTVGLPNIESLVEPDGWKFAGPWKDFSVHNMWSTTEFGSADKPLTVKSSPSTTGSSPSSVTSGSEDDKKRKKLENRDEYFEMQRRSANTQEWEFFKTTDADGHRLVNTKHNGMEIFDPKKAKPQKGWRYEGKWQLDISADKVDGWTYGNTEQALTRDEYADRDQRVNHKFRRRRWYIDLRKKKGSSAPRLEPEAQQMVSGLGNEQGWEYCPNDGAPTHCRQGPQDKVRRRRLLRLIEPITGQAEAATFSKFSLRIKQPQLPRIEGRKRKRFWSRRSSSESSTQATQSGYETPVSSSQSSSGSSSSDASDVEAALNPKTAFLAPRIYVVYDRKHTMYWQLRAYIYWGRDMLPTSTRGTNAFIRVIFMTFSKETVAVANSVNPIWNETLCFKKVLITGDEDRILEHPPHVLVQAYNHNGTPAPDFLGRFSAAPYVRRMFSAKPQSRVSGGVMHDRLQWFQLQFEEGQRGSVLAAFELCSRPEDPNTGKPESVFQDYEAKPGTQPRRFAVPSRIALTFSSYDIQFVCWGLRNLRRYRLTHVRSPYIQILVADQSVETGAIKDMRNNPNFSDPVITMQGVRLPENLYQAPPMTLHLYDTRAFGSRPLIGVCLIKDMKQYMRKTLKRFTREEKQLWSEKRKKLLALDIELNDTSKSDTKASGEKTSDEPEIDWWSKFYASVQETGKFPGYLEAGFETVQVYSGAVEDEDKFGGFKDFSQTFEFRKMKRSRFDEAELTDYQGELKGRLFIYARTSENTPVEGLDSNRPPGLEFSGPTECLVRVYIIRGFELCSRRRSGKCDPYAEVRCGKHSKASKRKEYRPDTLEPTFGQMFEFGITLPQDKSLKITVKDRRRFTADEEIGTTEIDLEDRLLTRHRATVGLSAKFNISGPTQWRDQLNPIAILAHYCKVHQLEPPEFVEDQNGLVLKVGPTSVHLVDALRAGGDLPPAHVHCGSAKHRLALQVLRQLKVGLVPEHIETRPLYNLLNPDVVQGRLQMFVDLFPKSLGPIPPPINIAPRTPKLYQLRLVVWNTRDVHLEKKSFGERVSDIYLKAFLNGEEKSQKTDVHYRSRDGAGAFNWRMVFDFGYNPWEKMMVIRKKRRWFRRSTEESVVPELVVQVWDNHKFSKDHYLGQIRMNLLKMEQAQLEATKMANVRKPKVYKCKRIVSCGCWKPRNEEQTMMKYIPLDLAPHSLFHQQRCRGWWPVFREGKATKGAHVTGKIELEIELVSKTAAIKNPVGKGRKKNPFLPKPSRPAWDSFWLTSRIKAIWMRTRWWMLLLLVVGIIAALLVIAVIFDIPSYFMDKNSSSSSSTAADTQ